MKIKPNIFIEFLAYLKIKSLQTKSDEEFYDIAFTYEIMNAGAELSFYNALSDKDLSKNHQILLYRKILEAMVLHMLPQLFEFSKENFRLFKWHVNHIDVGAKECEKYRKLLKLSKSCDIKKAIKQNPFLFLHGIPELTYYTNEENPYATVIADVSTFLKDKSDNPKYKELAEIIDSFHSLSGLLIHQSSTLLLDRIINSDKSNSIVTRTDKFIEKAFKKEIEKTGATLYNFHGLLEKEYFSYKNDHEEIPYIEKIISDKNLNLVPNIDPSYKNFSKAIHELANIITPSNYHFLLSLTDVIDNIDICLAYLKSPIKYPFLLSSLKQNAEKFAVFAELFNHSSVESVSFYKKFLYASFVAAAYIQGEINYEVCLEYSKFKEFYNEEKMSIHYNDYVKKILSNPFYILTKKNLSYSASVDDFFKNLNIENSDKYFRAYLTSVKLSHITGNAITMDYEKFNKKAMIALNVYTDFINKYIILLDHTEFGNNLFYTKKASDALHKVSVSFQELLQKLY